LILSKRTTVVLKTAKPYTAVLNTVTININMLDTAILDNNMTAIKSTAFNMMDTAKLSIAMLKH
jgi:hypothetical protein